MPDPTISDALAEAYASAPADKVIINTLSLWFDGLVDDNDDPTELYFFEGFTGDRRRDDGVPLRDMRLEPAARYHGGEVVEWIGIPFRVNLPDVSTRALPKGQIVLDNVGREVADVLMQAIAAGAGVELTYRGYLTGMEDDGPQNDPPIVFQLQNVTIDAAQVKGDLTIANIASKRFPGERYTLARFPGLTR